MSESQFHSEEAREPDRRSPDPAARKVVHSEQLLGGAREISIRHGGLEYRLQVTRSGKLILTK